jgi:hypothetical protein
MHESMDQAVPESQTIKSSDAEGSSLSYKFQRLREKLREGIANGELAGKLPGERSLARRFQVNAKTLSKALTDLAAEGLLDRSIGRGTYVKGSGPMMATGKRWLVICDPEQVDWDIVHLLRAAQPDLETVSDVTPLRPSFLNQFSAVIDLASGTPDAFIRDLVVRNVSVVLVGKEPKIYSTHAVVFDAPLAVAQVCRRLVLGGHRNLAAIESPQFSIVVDSLRLSLPRYAAKTIVHSCQPRDVAVMVEHGVTAFVCRSVESSLEVKAQLDRAGIPVPQRASVVAVGCISGKQPVSGFFIPLAEKADAILHLLKEQQGSRPTTIWLAGQFMDAGTLAPPHGAMLIDPDSNDDPLGHRDEVLQSV